MNIIGIGTDIVDIRRIKKILAQTYAQRFVERILHHNELIIFNQHTQKSNYLAKRFAAKEAVSKALGTGIGQSVQFNEVQVDHDELGAPMIKLHGRTKEYADQKGNKSTYVSLSDDGDYALAYVILTG